ncbi:hypothetical protein JCM33374_g2305 [Metschnikowia sp. JCM 33374]|nr:hypothetical protein JCM33374_g2305 [Metschnikowia sp. JCM 33374]
MRKTSFLKVIAALNLVKAGSVSRSPEPQAIHILETTTNNNTDTARNLKDEDPKGFTASVAAMKKLNAKEINSELLNILGPGEYIRMVLLDSTNPYNAGDINDWLSDVYAMQSLNPNKEVATAKKTINKTSEAIVDELKGSETSDSEPTFKDSKGIINMTMNNEFMKEIKDAMRKEYEEIYLGSFPAMSPEACELDSSIVEIRRLEDILEWFVIKLKSFMLQVVFDYREFELMGEELDHIIEDVNTSVLKVASCNKQLMNQLIHAKYMFSTMANSIELLGYYEKAYTPVHILIYSVVDLNIMLLALLSSQGIPDNSIEGFRDKVYKANISLQIWEKAFEGVENISFGKQVMFRRHFYAAENTARLLSKYVE